LNLKFKIVTENDKVKMLFVSLKSFPGLV
jgi:hypothetical protein